MVGRSFPAGAEITTFLAPAVRQQTAFPAAPNSGVYEFTVPRTPESRDVTVILELDKEVCGRATFKLYNEEQQRVGIGLAKGVV